MKIFFNQFGNKNPPYNINALNKNTILPIIKITIEIALNISSTDPIVNDNKAVSINLPFNLNSRLSDLIEGRENIPQKSSELASRKT